MSPTSTSAGCSIANATVRAIASGVIAMRSIRPVIADFTSVSVMEFARSVRTNPGEMPVTRSELPARDRAHGIFRTSIHSLKRHDLEPRRRDDVHDVTGALPPEHREGCRDAIQDAIRSRLRGDGWYVDRTRGSHEQWRHAFKPGVVTIAGKDSETPPPGTWASIEKQAGWR